MPSTNVGSYTLSRLAGEGAREVGRRREQGGSERDVVKGRKERRERDGAAEKNVRVRGWEKKN